MASTTQTQTFGTLMTFTFDAARKRIADNVTKTTSVLWALRGGKDQDMPNKRAIRYDVGPQIRIPVQWKMNGTAGSIGPFEPADTTPQDEFTAVFENFGENVASVAVARRDIRMNTNGLFSISDEKIKSATGAIKQEANRQMVAGTIQGGQFVRGNGGLDMVPLPILIGHLGTAGGTNAVAAPGATCHGVNPEAETWWKNQSQVGPSSATTYYDLFLRDMTRLYNSCKKGGMGEPVDFIISDQYSHELYERILHVKQRYGPWGADGVVSFGFKVLQFQNAQWIWDEFVPDVYTPNADPVSTGLGTIWMLNTPWMSFVIDPESDFVTTPFKQPYNQLAMYALLVLFANLTVENRRKFGIYTRVQHTATS